MWWESKDRADWPAGTSAGWRKDKVKGVNTIADRRGFRRRMLKVLSSSFNVQRTGESTHLVNSGDFEIAYKEISR